MPSARYPLVPNPDDAIQALQEAGVTPPAALVEVTDRWSALQAYRNKPTLSVADLATVPLAELEAAIDRAAILEASKGHLGPIVGGLSDTLLGVTARAIREAGDQLIAEARPSFDEAVAELEGIVAILGPDPDSSTYQQPKDAERIAAYFGPRTQALRAVRQAANISAYLARVSYLTGPGVKVSWYLHPAETQRRDEAEQLWEGTKGDWEHLLAAGFRLQLNTAAEVAEVEAVEVEASGRLQRWAI